MGQGRVTMEKLREILRLKQQCNLGNRTIAKAMGLSHTAVGCHIAACVARGITYETVSEMPDEEFRALLVDERREDDLRLKILHENIQYYIRELSRVGVTRHLLWEEYRLQHKDGYGYSQFCLRIQQWKDAQKLEMHVDHKAGDKLFVDYAGHRMHYVDRQSGEFIPVEIFVATLGASSYTYVEACHNQKVPSFIQACVNALHYIGGAPKAIVPDCLKSAVTRADRYESTINKTFTDFARHYGCAALPARPRKPKDKAKVEGAVRIVYQQIFAPLRDVVFYSLAEINRAINRELERYNDRIMQGYGKSRRELFLELDKPELTSLASRYEVKEYQLRRAGSNYHIYLPEDMHYYSVPHEYRNRMMNIWYTASHVEIYSDNRRIALHQRSIKKNGYTTAQEHLPPEHRFRDGWSVEKITESADTIGTHARAAIDKILEMAAHPEQGFKSCSGILSLTKKYLRADIDNACKYAIAINSVTYSSVKNILASRVHEHPPADTELLATQSLPEHDNIRGADYYTKELLH